MKSADNTASNGGSEKSVSGKKLVQARLPFKILSSTKEVGEPTKNESMKRRLSFPNENPSTKKVPTSEAKENISNCGDLVIISDDECDIQSAASAPLSPTLNPFVKLQNIDHLMDRNKKNEGQLQTPTVKKSHKRNHSNAIGSFVIKMPFNCKRKLNNKDVKEADHSETSFEESNPEKKIKLSPNKLNGLDNKGDKEAKLIYNCNEDSNSIEIIEADEPKTDTQAENKSTNHTTNQESSNEPEIDEGVVDQKAEDTLNQQNETETSVEKMDISIESIDIDSSSSEEESVPKEDVNMKVEDSNTDNDVLDSGENENAEKSLISKSLTPGQRKKLEEMEKKREERKRIKEERERKALEEKLQRKREHEERIKQRRREKEEREEQKRKEREEKEEQRRKEKEERERKRLAEIEAKNEEKRKKEELKEEEKRKREEERKKKEQEKEEAENKKRKAAEAFTKFFVQSKAASKNSEEDQNSMDSEKFQHNTFMPFQVKGDMKLAPLYRRILNAEEKTALDGFISSDNDSTFPAGNLYLQCLKEKKFYPRKDSRTGFKDDMNNDVIIVYDEFEEAGQKIDDNRPILKHRAKFLYFHENRRPPYYGTWRKKTEVIKPRRPLTTDKAHFDYDIDSDEEWEEEEPGESLHGSDDEKESEDEYEVDNVFFVPHGHLSEEELQNDDDDNSPETQKAKLQLLQQEFAQEMKKKTEKIKSRLVGVIWQDEKGCQPEECPDIIWRSLNKRAMLFSNYPITIAPGNVEGDSCSPSQEKKPMKRTQVAEEDIKDLIKLVHGNKHKKSFLIKEFQAYLPQKHSQNGFVGYTNASIRECIEKISKWKIISDEVKKKKKKKLCWIVEPEYLQQYELEDLSSVNKWEYILQPTTSAEPQQNVDSEVNSSKEKKQNSAIIKYAKVIKAKEQSPDLSSTPVKDKGSTSSSEPSSSKKVKISRTDEKVVQESKTSSSSNQIAKTPKNKLISSFLRKHGSNCKNSEDTCKEEMEPIIID